MIFSLDGIAPQIDATAWIAHDANIIGRVVLEAQASGIPVIVSDVGGPRDLVAHGVDGVTAAVKLAEALVSLGLGTSKHGDLDFPRAKAFSGQFEHLSHAKQH